MFIHKDPFNYTRAEWERAKKTDRTPPEIAEAIRDAWVLSDNKKTFKNALKERGFYLAKGKRGRFVTVDHYGEVYAVTKKIKLKKEQVTKRLGDVNELQSVEETKELISQRLTAQFKAYITELRKKQRRDYAPLQTEKYDMTGLHRQERAKLQTGQEKRWQAEELKRNTRMRSGFKGLWDKLTGSYQRTRRRNETETEKNQLRDNKEKQKLINVQLTHRQKLQGRFQVLRKTHKQERAELFKSVHARLGCLKTRLWLKQGKDFSPLKTYIFIIEIRTLVFLRCASRWIFISRGKGCPHVFPEPPN